VYTFVKSFEINFSLYCLDQNLSINLGQHCPTFWAEMGVTEIDTWKVCEPRPTGDLVSENPAVPFPFPVTMSSRSCRTRPKFPVILMMVLRAIRMSSL
jgi:hypothetical protein